MKPLKHLPFIIFTSTFLFGCCLGTPDCLPVYFHYASLRIVSAADGKDLVFGQSRIYVKERIVFYSSKGNDTTFFNWEPVKVNEIKYDSIIDVDFFPATDIAFMRLSNGDIDTLKLTYRTNKKSPCCNESSELTSINVNNISDLNVKTGVQEIKK